MAILVHWHLKEDGLLQKVQKRLREELGKVEVKMNLEKTKVERMGEQFGITYSAINRIINIRNQEWKRI